MDETENIAVIMMATMGGRMSPALYGVPLDRVEEFLEQPETEGVIRGSKWFLCYTTLTDYIKDFNREYVLYRDDTGRQDACLDRLGIPKIPITELIEKMGRKPAMQGNKYPLKKGDRA